MAKEHRHRRDARGLLITAQSDNSVDRYEAALKLFHGYFGDPLSVIDAALRDEPEFLMGHALRAGLIAIGTERRHVPELRASVTQGEALIAAGLGTERERAHLAAARTWLDGDFAGACDAYNRITIDFPRDALALQIAHLCNFFLGRATWLRDGIAAALPHYAPGEPTFGYAQGMLAFGLEECNEFGIARAAGERALAENPRDPWAIHALGHCAEMEGKLGEGIELYESRVEDWAPENFFAVHNWWHLGLFYLEAGEANQVLDLYDTRVRATPSEIMLDMIDASAFLWRLELSGIDVGARWQELAECWRRLEEEGYYAFNDLHALMAYAGAGSFADVSRVIAGLERAGAELGTNGTMARDVGLPAARGFAAFARGDYQGASRELFAVRTSAQRFGGSNAQRDIIEWTLVEAALRAGDASLGRALVEARLRRKSTSPMQHRLLARVFDGLGAPTLAFASRERAARAVPARQAAAE